MYFLVDSRNVSPSMTVVQEMMSSMEMVTSLVVVSSVREIVSSEKEVVSSIGKTVSSVVAVSGCMLFIMANNKRKRRNIPPKLNSLCIIVTPFL